MNDKSELVPLELIDANPFQVRLSEDPEAVAAIAASIERDGLLQNPTARQTKGRYQLAFGHTRFAAFIHLHESGRYQEGTYASMQLIVRELTDLQMFELAVAENIKRRDLNPIEQAHAMQTYLDTFRKTSEEAGEFFGVSAETVRGKVRLLQLPDAVQARVSRGEIGEGVSRLLLTAAKISNPEEMNALAQDLAEGEWSGEQAADNIETKLRSKLHEMWDRYDSQDEVEEEIDDEEIDDEEYERKLDEKTKSVTPRGGKRLWPLDWKHAGLPPMTPKDVAKILEFDVKAYGPATAESLEIVVGQLSAGMRIVASALPSDVLEKIQLLINPPACTECSLYVKLNGTHYCGLKACWARKKQAFVEQEFHKDAAKLKIPVYDKAQDGAFQAIDYNNRDSFRKLFKDKDPFLRIRPEVQYYNPYELTDSYYAELIDVKPARIEAAKEKRQASRAADDWNSPENVARRKREEELRDRGDKFFDQAAGPFSAAFEGMDCIPALEALTSTRTKPALPKKQRLQKLYAETAKRALENTGEVWRIRQAGPMAVAKHLQGVAKTWGVKLPADFLERAQAMMPVDEKPAAKKAKARAK